MTLPRVLFSGILRPGEKRTVRCDVPADWMIAVAGPGREAVTVKRVLSEPAPPARVTAVELENTSGAAIPFTLLAASPGATMAGYHAAGFLKSILS